MDSYLAKPPVTQDLWNVLAQVTSGKGSEAMGMLGDPRAIPEPVWSPDTALALVDGDRELLQELVAVALDNVPPQIAALRDAVHAADATRAAAAAHTLKGTMAAIGALGIVEPAGRLEALSRGGDLPGVTAALGPLERAMDRLTAKLLEFRMRHPEETRPAASGRPG
jgi:HPt (histidine-containing phosphotransfer) domain-containing protein